MSCIAVLGGGISGLSTAYYLARLAPKTTQIVLLEGKQRLGGWIQSHRVSPGHYTTPPQNSQDNTNSILFEAGPRSLRPEGTNGAILLDMVHHLNLNDHLLSVPKTDPSSKHRYIYYNGKINTLPTSLSSLLFNKPEIFKSVILAGALEPLRSSRFTKDGEPKDGLEDESMYHFMKRRFNEHTAINLMGSLAHGIYAGDVKQLSIQSTLRVLYEAEKNHGSVVLGMLRGNTNIASMRERGMAVRARDGDPEWFGKMEKMSVLGFKHGMETLPQQLVNYLQSCPNVTIVKNDPVQSIQTIKDDQVKVEANDLCKSV
jgi:oxygen-dependent protoporphyrinogen oxidase